ncbi:MAG TPA: cytochrome ubiquinol oxidase subunit I [Gemmatimonadales bacterium]|nr:cytochrome ubiquinol oxidase subunit I [Gemmatimonadales bacterium]
MDVVLLSRIQFALTIGFHFLFPPLTIGLAWLLVLIEWRGWRRNDPTWVRMGRFFSKLLALTFAVGVATGIVMEFQFGTNWAVYSKFVGDIFGAPLAAEGVLAFFLESGFLGLYLFGRGRVSRGAHWFSILMVAVGSTISAFWILVANSWQQTPAGFVVRNGRAELVSFAAAVFNPSTLPRFFHTVDAALVAGAFLVAGVAAYLLRKDRDDDLARRALTLALVFGLVASATEVFPFGHVHARQVAHTQPEKFAAIEGLYSSQSAAPMVLFAYPVTPPPELKAKVEIRGVLSWLAFGDINAPIRGITDFPPENRPPLWLTFVSFHNMVVLGMYFIAALAWGTWRLRGGRLWGDRRYLLLLVVSIPLPLAACQLGWMAAEVGRQPWIVYGLLRTSDAVSRSVPAGDMLFSLLLFAVLYLLLGALYVYLLVREIRHGPPGLEPALA